MYSIEGDKKMFQFTYAHGRKMMRKQKMAVEGKENVRGTVRRWLQTGNNCRSLSVAIRVKQNTVVYDGFCKVGWFGHSRLGTLISFNTYSTVLFHILRKRLLSFYFVFQHKQYVLTAWQSIMRL